MTQFPSATDRPMRTLLAALVLVPLAVFAARAQQSTGVPGSGASDKPPYNIIFVISDQRAYRLFAGDDYSLPGIDAIARHGVTFRNHYIASAMCTPSRAAFLSGQPPQVNGVFDQMQYDFVPTLSPDLPNMGSVLKGLGYKTAYFGKFEMDKKSSIPSRRSLLAPSLRGGWNHSGRFFTNPVGGSAEARLRA